MPPGPAGFAVQFATARNAFNTKYQEYVDAGQNDEVETQSKAEANNAIHAAVMSMFLDGQMIFKNNEAKKKLFTFEQVLLNIAGPGAQGFKGNITRSDNQDVTEGTVEFEGPTNKAVNIDSDGHFNCAALTAGPGYKMTVTVDGCAIYIQEGLEVETGVMKTVNSILTPIP